MLSFTANKQGMTTRKHLYFYRTTLRTAGCITPAFGGHILKWRRALDKIKKKYGLQVSQTGLCMGTIQLSVSSLVGLSKPHKEESQLHKSSLPPFLQDKDTYGENPAALSDKYLDKAEKR